MWPFNAAHLRPVSYRNRAEITVLTCDQNPEGVLGLFLLGMCRWPLRAPTPLESILWPIIDPILVPIEQRCDFRDLN